MNKRTSAALGDELMEQLKTLHFCIVGCGGTGANFAEMLVRSGARRLVLIDGGTVKKSGLNRVFGFTAQDVGKPKAKALAHRLKSIVEDELDVCALEDSFRGSEQILDHNTLGQRVRDAVYDADVVFAATDTNSSRLRIEQLCRDKEDGMLLGCGVRVDREGGEYRFECAWLPKTPENKGAVEGYGPENASFAAIVLEATSVAFMMLLSHLRDGKSQFRRYRRSYDANFTVVDTSVS